MPQNLDKEKKYTTFNALDGLDNGQTKAASVQKNAIVSAGAGSGKTRVLAARYVYLVTEKGYTVDQIVTLTFTKKAVTEMYTRIYDELLKASAYNERAKKAVADFHTARISTLDSFSAAIVRPASRMFALSPDFRIDPAAIESLIKSSAFPFVLNHRENPALIMLLGQKSIEDVVRDVFVKTFTSHANLSKPINFEELFKKQCAEILAQWKEQTAQIDLLMQSLKITCESSTNPKTLDSKFYINIKKACLDTEEFEKPTSEEIASALKGDSNSCKLLIAFYSAVHSFVSISLPGGRITNPEILELKTLHSKLKELFLLWVAVVNYILSADTIKSIFPLLAEFQEEINRQKRAQSMVSYGDVAQMALDVLLQFPDVRQNEKSSIKTIMIDEFQDNNDIQRDLLFLLAEREDVCSKGIPSADALCADKLFFVGDEKQSIYKFRGADVSVFRGLKNDMGAQSENHFLSKNYRSHPTLIHLFNTFFGSDGGVFLNEPQEAYEAEYVPAEAFAPPPDSDVRMHVFLHNTHKAQDEENQHSFADDDSEDATEMAVISSIEKEALFAARTISDLVAKGHKIFKNNKGKVEYKACTYSDFAILFRRYKPQFEFEKQLRLHNIPYNAESLVGFFNDAPINDMYSLLRLCVYPSDTHAYGSLLRSAFCGISRETMLFCLAQVESVRVSRKETGETGLIDLFSDAIAEKLVGIEAQKFTRCKDLYQELCALKNSKSIAEIVTYLWYEVGYRYETLWNNQVQLYSELYDYFFELAVQADAGGKSLIAFVDSIAEKKLSGERIDEVDVPTDRQDGVRLMSIHKSKGLEFPIVFVPDAGSSRTTQKNTEMYFFDEDNGLSFNTQLHAELPSSKSAGKIPNYFFLKQKELEDKKSAAELRRVFYVALTRAESEIYLSASYKLDTTKLADDSLSCALSELESKKEGKLPRSFLDLLLSGLNTIPTKGLYTLQALPDYDVPKTSEALSKQETAIRHEQKMQKAQEISVSYPQNRIFSPSAIHYQSTSVRFEQSTTIDESKDAVIIRNIVESYDENFTYADFGTIAHAYTESALNSMPPIIPARIRSTLTETEFAQLEDIAKRMADSFVASNLGKQVANALWFKTEFPFKSCIKTSSVPSGSIFLSGKMDLIFETENEIGIIDFKTDQSEDDRHRAQLALYAHAAKAIYAKPVHTWLFYLRTGNEIDCTAQVAELNVEELVAANVGE